MSNLPITITVKLFTPYQEAEGLSELKLEFPKETPVSQVLERLSATPPPVLGATHLLRYQPRICPRPTPLQNGDEVVLIPPVSSPLLPSDSPPMAISLSPGGRSS
ncbi:MULTISPECIES: MoaD/ThiS family protein [unclassified Microcoleus]|uniref:MoaD/ThiS family protein n=1 Tax=unclassified Microcoleus TaxID=2642155 RepID=UPI002FCFA292